MRPLDSPRPDTRLILRTVAEAVGRLGSQFHNWTAKREGFFCNRRLAEGPFLTKDEEFPIAQLIVDWGNSI